MGKLSSVTHIPVLNIPHHFKPYTTFYITNLILYLHFFNITFSIPITPSDTENYLPSDDPNITNLMVSHYDCAKQHNLRQFNLLNVKQCNEAPSDIKHASVKARVYVRAKAKRIKVFKCVAYAKKKGKYVFKVPSNTVVLIEPYGIIKHYRSLLLLIQSNAKTLYDI